VLNLQVQHPTCVQICLIHYVSIRLAQACPNLYITMTHNGGMHYFLPFLSLTRLELLSTIQEIRGPLRIDGWPGQTFPYLRNLRRIGHPNGTTLTTNCGGQCELSWLISAVNAEEWRAVYSYTQVNECSELFFLYSSIQSGCSPE